MYSEKNHFLMRKIMYEDCNNNAVFLKKIFEQAQTLSGAELKWKISNIDFIPIDKGDFVGGMPDDETKKLYDFRTRLLNEHVILIGHSAFMQLMKNIKTIYEGKFETLIIDKQLVIKVFDGDMIEIDGEIGGVE